jgi:ABC-2 type transport system ATP-binding protein
MDSIRGKVWQKKVSRQALEEYQREYNVIRSHLNAGETVIHVFSDVQPEGFDPVDADLEDVYFATLISNGIPVSL